MTPGCALHRGLQSPPDERYGCPDDRSVGGAGSSQGSDPSSDSRVPPRGRSYNHPVNWPVRSRQWLGVGVMVCIALLQPLTELLGTRDFARFLDKVVVVAAGTPLVLLLGSRLSRRATARGGGVVAGGVGGGGVGGVFVAL